MLKGIAKPIEQNDVIGSRRCLLDLSKESRGPDTVRKDVTWRESRSKDPRDDSTALDMLRTDSDTSQLLTPALR